MDQHHLDAIAYPVFLTTARPIGGTSEPGTIHDASRDAAVAAQLLSIQAMCTLPAVRAGATPVLLLQAQRDPGTDKAPGQTWGFGGARGGS